MSRRHDPKLPHTVAIRGVTPKQLDFIEWLVTPTPNRIPSDQQSWALQHQCDKTTLVRWKTEPDFRKEWDRRLHELKINPESISQVLAALQRAGSAERPDVQAAKLWLEVAGVYTKKSVVEVDDKRDLKDLSDAELDELLAAEAGDELATRRASNG